MYPQNKILVVCKRTKFELALENYPDIEEFKKICGILNNSFHRIYFSHERQIQAREFLKSGPLNGAKFVFRKELSSVNFQDYELVIALGGDNHFTYVGHLCLNQNNIILGCNSDTQTSLGALLYYNPNDLAKLIENDWNDTTIEEWPLIVCDITYPNGSFVQTIGAISEITVRNNNPDLISRYLISYNGEIEDQKSSGVLLSTGAGSTGWYQSCQPYNDYSEVFSKTSPYFKVFSRELSKTARKRYKFNNFTVYDSCSLFSDMDGGITIDSLPERNYKFPPGSVAHFYLSSQKLRVLSG